MNWHFLRTVSHGYAACESLLTEVSLLTLDAHQHPILDHSFACEQAGETASGPLECAFEWSWRKVVGSAPTRARSLRLKLNESQDFSWVVHEISVEGRR